MHPVVWFNGSLREASGPSLSAFSSAAQFGKGIFTTVRIDGRAPFLWSKHWNRLRANADAIGVDLSGFSESEVARALDELIATNRVGFGRARLTFFDEASGELWSQATEKSTSLLIATADLRPLPETYRLGVSRSAINSQSPLTGIKSCNYLEKILALDEAKRAGFHEAIQTNERDEIASACMANVFWSKDGALFTPVLETGSLAGTTRELILENLECRQVRASIDQLRDADEIFLTSAGIGVAQVAEFDGRKLRRDDHPIMKLLTSR